MIQRQKILVVDDNHMSLNINVSLLSEIDAEIVTASSGKEAIRKTSAEDFDLVLLDVMMPDIDGFQTLNIIRQDERYKFVPVIFITAFPADELKIINGLSLGAVDFIKKPISKEILRIKANNLLELQRNRKELSSIKNELLLKMKELEIREIEFKKAERMIIKERNLMNSVFGTAQTIILVLDTKCNILNFNRYMEEISGYKLEEVKGKEWFLTFIPECGRSHIKEIFSRGISNIQTIGNVNPIVTKDGQLRYIEWYDKSLKDEHDNIIGLVSVGQDITEKMKIEDELLKYREHLETLVEERTNELKIEKNKLLKAQEIAHVGTFEYSFTKDSFIFTSETSKILGLESISEFSFNSLKELLFPDDLGLFFSQWTSLMKGRNIDAIFRFLLNGSIKYIRLIANLVTDDKRGWETVLGYVFDLTNQYSEEKQRKELEDKIHQTQKMESITILSAGVAHNFNNLLNGMLGFSTLFLAEYPENGKNRDYLNHVIEQGNKAANLVRQMLVYTKPEKQLMKSVDMKMLVRETVKLMQTSFIRNNIETRVLIDSKCPPMIGDSQYLQQLLLNVFRNAEDAMEEKGGLFEIEMKEIFLISENLPSEGMEPGAYIMLSLRDSGHGMAPEVKEHIFDPFFTTKDKGKGTGLGLYTVHSTLLNHKGGVTVESEPGKGTTFKFYFPAIGSLMEQSKETVKLLPEEENLILESHARVLVAEDEPIICKVYELSLTRLGYSVTTAMDGLEALKIFTVSPDNFDIIITDQIMPKMLGTEFCKQVLKIVGFEKPLFSDFS